MNKKTKKIIWAPKEEMSITDMDLRIRSATSQYSWQEVIKIFLDENIQIDKLKVVEIGCGTGTMALTFGLMGASVTLIDFNENVLEKTEKIYELYGCKAKLIKADCLDIPPDEIIGIFDLVISNGLAEHFSERNREKCIAYHRLLLKNRGVAFIEVPNRLNPLYQFVRFFRKITGTWKIDVEIPFTPKELKNIAEIIGFVDSYVIGYVSLYRDFLDYVRGFISAIIDILPKNFGEMIRKWKKNIKTQVKSSVDTSNNIRKHCWNIVEYVKNNNFRKSKFRLKDKYCSHIVLFAFK